MVGQPSPLTLCPQSMLVSLFLLQFCAQVTQLYLLISRLWLLVHSSNILLGLTRWNWTIFGCMLSLAPVVAHQSSLLTNILQIDCLSSWWKLWKHHKVHGIWTPYWTFFSSFNTTVMALFRDASVITYTCTLTNTFSHGFKPYMNCVSHNLWLSQELHYYIIKLGNVLLYSPLLL